MNAAALDLLHSEQAHEAERLRALKAYEILDTDEEEAYDQITQLASQICGTPVSLISLLDLRRQWFKSHHGLTIKETDRKLAFCAHAIQTPEKIMVVNDATEDERFAENPLVHSTTPVRFYAGVPLVSYEGYALGTLCVIDHKARQLSEEQLHALKMLGDQTMRLFEMRKQNLLLKKQREALCAKNEELSKFAYVVSHDLKSPLNNISALCSMWTEAQKADDPSLGLIQDATHTLRSLIDGILNHYSADHLLDTPVETIDVRQMLRHLADLYRQQAAINIKVQAGCEELPLRRAALQQVLINLISNAIKHNLSDEALIEVEVSRTEREVTFAVSDNGAGIAQEEMDKIFELFGTLGRQTRNGEKSTGIGLATVQKLVSQQEGKLHVESIPGLGSTFSLSLPVD